MEQAPAVTEGRIAVNYGDRSEVRWDEILDVLSLIEKSRRGNSWACYGVNGERGLITTGGLSKVANEKAPSRFNMPRAPWCRERSATTRRGDVLRARPHPSFAK